MRFAFTSAVPCKAARARFHIVKNNAAIRVPVIQTLMISTVRDHSIRELVVFSDMEFVVNRGQQTLNDDLAGILTKIVSG
jgi:hypothetical protein